MLAGDNPDLRSVVICLEDSLHETEVGAAQDVFCATLRALEAAPPALIAYTRIPPFIATLGMMVTARGASKWWSKGNPISFPTHSR